MPRSTVVTDSVHQDARVRIADKWIGSSAPVFVIAEIGINHNGSLDVARRLIDGAILAGADAVKFQKRTPEKCVPLIRIISSRELKGPERSCRCTDP